MMEDLSVKALESTARHGGVICATMLAAFALTACSAGQITQTSSQVAAVDGASANAEDDSVAVRDVTVKIDENDKASLKFVAVNQDYSQAPHRLESVQVDGKDAGFNPRTIDFNCTLISDSAEGQQDRGAACIDYTETPLRGDFAYGGNVTVTFNFDSGSFDVTATVAQEQPEVGTFER